MSSDLTIPRVDAAAAAVDVARSRTGAPAEQATADGTTGQVPSTGQAPSTGKVPSAGKVLANPTLRLDPGLAIVVIEFRDAAGAVRSTVPTEQQLAAYRSWDRGHAPTVATQGPAGQPEAAPTPAPVKHSATDTRG